MELIPFEATRYLKDEQDIQGYLTIAAEEAEELNDIHILLQAIETAAKARGIMQVAKEAGVSRESLYKSLSGHHQVRFSTIVKVLHALGMQLTLSPKSSL